jgi:branched-chain amino acid transport system permease protein
MLIQQLVNGLTLGAVYTLIALSFSLVMGVLGVLNIAIAELFMIGGYLGFTLIAAGLPIPVAIAGGMVGAGLIAVVIEKVGYQPLRDAPVIVPLLSTLGFAIILRDVATNIWGSNPLLLPGDFLVTRIEIGPVSIGSMQLVVIVTTIVLVAAMAYLVQRTPVGRGLRAVAENRDVARLLGVSAARLTTVAFGLSGLLAGAAGVLIGMHYTAMTPYIGVETGLKAIAVMVIGGVARIWGALLAGPLIGVLEVLTVAYGGSQIRDMVVYGFMILVLLLRPQGLLGGRFTGTDRV